MRSQFNSNLNNVLQSGTIALADKVRRIEADGKKIIPLHTGDPDFATPEPIIRAANEAMKAGFTHYANSRGIDELRKSISEYLIKRGLISYSPADEILVTHGGIHAYFIALMTIVETGDEIIIQDPTWMSHFNIIKLLGGVPVSVDGKEENNFCMLAGDIESKITSKTKAIVINSPSNPTGGIYGSTSLKKIIKIALRYNLFIIADEVYDHIILDPTQKFTSLASFEEIKERLFLCNSFSKTFAMTGWRVGYLCTHSKILNQALKIAQCTITNVAPFIQKAAHVALTDATVEPAVAAMVNEYKYRAEKVMELVKKFPQSPVRLTKPKGAFYFFADVRGMNKGNSQQVAESLLDEIAVAAVPGSVFGTNGEGYLRLTIAASREYVVEGFTRLLSLKS
jgi:aspartate/methionine/tyrosine aminotransferase